MFGSSGAAGSDKQTKKEMASEAMRRRLLKHIEDWLPEHTHKSPQQLDFITDDGQLELWECTLTPPKGSPSDVEKVWLFWDEEEIKSYQSYNSAFVDFVAKQRSKKIEARFRYFTSPLTVSAILALLMLLLIAYLSCFREKVPDQLWSIFTAVIAFYFGRESGARAGHTDGAE